MEYLVKVLIRFFTVSYKPFYSHCLLELLLEVYLLKVEVKVLNTFSLHASTGVWWLLCEIPC